MENLDSPLECISLRKLRLEVATEDQDGQSHHPGKSGAQGESTSTGLVHSNAPHEDEATGSTLAAATAPASEHRSRKAYKPEDETRW